MTSNPKLCALGSGTYAHPRYKAIYHRICSSLQISLQLTGTMLHTFSMAMLAMALSMTAFVSGLGNSCSAPITQGTAAPGDPYWMETIKHQGTAAFNPNPSGYQVFRNVKVCIIVIMFCGLWTCNLPFSEFRRERRWCHRRYSCDKVIFLPIGLASRC